MSAPPYISSHTFTVEKEDFPHVEYLYNTYISFISCVYNRYLNISSKINSNLLRYFFFKTEPIERSPKTIHYYKNVNTIWIHRPLDYKKSAWDIRSYKWGHFISHFRSEMNEIYLRNFTGPIRKLNIDFEYVFFLLKNFTNYCWNKNNQIIWLKILMFKIPFYKLKMFN